VSAEDAEDSRVAILVAASRTSFSDITGPDSAYVYIRTGLHSRF
jgi:hypothetical protein